MKRSGPLERGKGIAPGKGLKPGAGLKRKAPLKASAPANGEPRAAVPTKRAKSPRLVAYEAEFRRASATIRRISGGRCEAAVAPGCTGHGAHVHHRWRRPGPNTLANLLHLCAPCHTWVHANPRAATERGLLLPRGTDPGSVDVQTGPA